ncbi:endolytic transglycosylase MltG [Nautilia lithotrophica]
MNKKRIIVNIIAFIEFLLVCTIFILFYLTRNVYSPRVIYIPTGSVNYTINSLQKRGYNVGFIDKIFLYLLGSPQAGWIDLKSEKLTKFDFLYKLTTSKAALVKVTIIPGETTYYVYKILENKLKIPNINCGFEEGFLKPDTYFLPIGMKKTRVCEYLKQKSLIYHKQITKKIFGKFEYEKYRKYLIIASIIQKEAANVEEMKKISAVIYNRLKKHMKLQMDGSLNYGQYSHEKITPQRIKNDSSRFNTYKYYGLPDKPVCIPSRDAIIAAIFPEKSKYLYFVKCGKKHLFAVTYKQHLRNIKKCKR